MDLCVDGIPHRAIVSSRTPSGALRTMGAMESGMTRAWGGELTVQSRMARESEMIAACPLVTE
jgi:hypothetical protein